MLEKLEQIEQTYDELAARLADPDVLANPGLFRDTSRALAELNPVVELYQRYKKTRDELDQTAELLGELEREDDMYEMAAEEKGLLEETLASIEATMKEELAPKDPNEKRNAVLEIRAGTGGDEATLFAAELFRMYGRYADDHGWKVEILDMSESGIRGVKEVSAIVEGRGAFATLRYEAGVHRVQAMRVLKSRLLEIEEAKANAEMGEERRRMVGSGDRSEKIRTYNFPQNRVTDHRVGLSVHKLPQVLEGDLEPLIVPLRQHFEAERLRQTGEADPV
ncbi:MAG: PCRF domain-containing protein [Acidobacteriota bacterium]|nr:PCRF domain-containing protein [Acidobacteriota bacterium]